MTPPGNSPSTPSGPSPSTEDLSNLPADSSTVGQINDFAEQANEAAPSFLREFVDFLREYGVWWLTPLLIVLLLLAGAAFLGGSAAAPFIYPLF